MQNIKRLNIGTAKITDKEKEGVVHHLLNIKSIKDDYSVYEYQKDARSMIEKLQQKIKILFLLEEQVFI
jgi:tRNA dimethylallyltransferase